MNAFPEPEMDEAWPMLSQCAPKFKNCCQDGNYSEAAWAAWNAWYAQRDEAWIHVMIHVANRIDSVLHNRMSQWPTWKSSSLKRKRSHDILSAHIYTVKDLAVQNLKNQNVFVLVSTVNVLWTVWGLRHQRTLKMWELKISPTTASWCRFCVRLDIMLVTKHAIEVRRCMMMQTALRKRHGFFDFQEC